VCTSYQTDRFSRDLPHWDCVVGMCVWFYFPASSLIHMPHFQPVRRKDPGDIMCCRSAEQVGVGSYRSIITYNILMLSGSAHYRWSGMSGTYGSVAEGSKYVPPWTIRQVPCSTLRLSSTTKKLLGNWSSCPAWSTQILLACVNVMPSMGEANADSIGASKGL